MELEEIYKTKSTAIYQGERGDTFYLRKDAEEIPLKFCDIFSLKKKIMAIDLVKLMDSDAPDVEVIHLPNSDRFLILNIFELLEFRELLNGTFNILALNSAIYKILRKGAYN